MMYDALDWRVWTICDLGITMTTFEILGILYWTWCFMATNYAWVSDLVMDILQPSNKVPVQHKIHTESRV